jgi:hypothetical protein
MARAGNIRTVLADAWDNMPEDQRAEVEKQAVEIWTNILTATKAQWSYCPDCRCKVQADFPDFANQAKALQIFADQVYGEPAKTHQVTVDYGEVTLEAIHGMTMLELARIARIDVVDGEIVDAEFDEQPALPPVA